MAYLSRLFRSKGALMRAAGLALSLTALAGSSAAAAAAVPSHSLLEESVKASYLFKFAPFVEWPPRVRNKPFVICIIDEEHYAPVLEDVVRGQKIGGQPVLVRRLADGTGADACQILFAGRSEQADSASPFASLTGQPVLTVADRTSGIAGAMIYFVIQNGRVRFQIDDSIARANGLTISSKLLGLAVAVERK